MFTGGKESGQEPYRVLKKPRTCPMRRRGRGESVINIKLY